MNFAVEKFNHENPCHLAARERISLWSKESGSMVPMEPEQVGAHPFSVIARGESCGQVLGYSAITVVYDSVVGEFGGLVVSPHHRGSGIGAKLSETVVQEAKTALPELEQVIAFANGASLPLFQTRLGATVISDTAAIPAACWDLCALCPNRPPGFTPAAPVCCDVAVELHTYGEEG